MIHMPSGLQHGDAGKEGAARLSPLQGEADQGENEGLESACTNQAGGILTSR
jgi:hypothetical protein